MSKKNLGIYIHIPFCNGKCPYCSFYSINPNNKYLVKNYIDSVCRQIKHWGNMLNHNVDTVYFGGGTPSTIDSYFIVNIINTIKASFHHNLKEVTIEVNPSDYKKIDFRLLKNAGINRVSLGAQSINDRELNILGRKHNVNDIIMAIDSCRKYGINNISLDLILGVTHQDCKNLNNSIDFCIENNISHISSYLLKIEKNTPYFNMQESLSLPSDEEQASLYEFLCGKLRENNYLHYEISNFCIENFESIHNLKYWNCDEYLGIGPSAHSFIDGKRFYYPNSISQFIKSPNLVQDGNGGSIEEYCMLALRLSSGLNNTEFYKKFNRSIPSQYFKNAKKLEKYELVICSDNEIKLTDKGFLLSNSIILNIIY